MAVLTNIPNNTSARDWRDTVNALIKRIAALEAAGVPVATPAPAFTTQPSISPTSGTAGSTLYAATPGTVSNGSVVSRAWLLNGVAISTGVTALPASSGTLAYQETASGPGGTTTSTVQVAAVTAATVTPAPAPSFTTQPSISPTSGTAGTTTFTAAAGNVSNGSITARSWTINGTVISTGLTASPASSGTLTYQETATGSGGTTQSTVQQVTVATAAAAAPAFTTQPTVSPSAGTAGTTTYTATPGAVSNGTVTSRAWSLNGSVISTGLTAAPASAGTLTYQEFATGTGGSASSSVLTRTVSAAAPTLVLSPNAPSIAWNAAAGTLVSAISNVPTGVTPSVTPNDGRLVIAGSASVGWKVVVGLSSLSMGQINFSVAATGTASANGVLTVSAAQAMTLNTLAAGPGRVPTSFQANTNVGTFPITTRAPAWASGDGAIRNLRTGDVGRAWVAFPDSDNAGPYRFKRTLEYPVGVYHDVTWAGAPDVIVPPGVEIALSDMILDSRNGQPLVIPAAAKFYWITVFLAINGAATGYPRISVPATPASVGEEHGLVYGQDYSKGGTVPPSAEGWVYEPAFVRGDVAAANARSMYIMSDSKNAEGTSDVTSYGPRGGHGMVQRTCDKLMIPYMINGRATATATHMISSAQKYHAKLFAAVGVSHAHMAMGSNDLSGSSNGYAILQRFEAVMATIPAQIVLGVNTIQPGAQSSDRFTTLENQVQETLARRNARLYINQEIRKKTGITAFLASGYIFDEEDFIATGRGTAIQKLPPNNRILLGSATIAAGSATLTVAGANFTAADIGTGIFVVGAGASAADLGTVVQAVTNSTTVVVLNAAGTAVSGANCNIGSLSIDGTHAVTQGCVLFADFAAPFFPPASTETITLGTLTLSAAIVAGTASTGTIVGATRGSAIASNVTGLTVNGPARTYSWDGTGPVGTVGNGLVETLAGAVGSAKSSPVTVSAS